MPELVNQPYQLLQWWSQALVACHCRKEHGITSILALTGKDNRVACAACGKQYYIAGYALSPEGPVLVIQADLPPSRLM